MKLKTLKDIRPEGETSDNLFEKRIKSILKQEAIKWIKDFRKIQGAAFYKPNGEFKPPKFIKLKEEFSVAKGKKGVIQLDKATKDFFISKWVEFFNIPDEDLK